MESKEFEENEDFMCWSFEAENWSLEADNKRFGARDIELM